MTHSAIHPTDKVAALSRRTADLAQPLDAERTANRTLRAAAPCQGEERYHRLLDALPDAVVIESGGKIAFVNPAAVTLFGATNHQQLVGCKGYDLVAAPHRAGHAARLREVLERGVALPAVEEAHVRVDGTEVQVEVHSTFITWNTLPACLAVIRDVTERRKTEEALRQSEETARALINAAPDIAVLLDRSFTILAANAMLARRFGMVQADLIGNNLYDVMPAETRDLRRAKWVEALTTGQLVRYESERAGRWLENDIHPILGAGGKVVRLAIFAHDITQRRQFEHGLREAKEAAELANHSKSEFLANMSHELRTPLNAIMGFSQIMHAEMFGALGNARYRGYAKDIMDSGQHLLGIIDDILDLAKIEAGKLTPVKSRLDARAAIEAAIRIVMGRAEKQGIEIKQRIAPRLPDLIADERMLKQMLMNLLSNAVKFTPKGGKVCVSARRERSGALAIMVTDTGIGIAAEDIPRVMAPFGQVESVLSRHFQGTGLGLPLTKSLAELHGGTLELTSKPGLGTRVTVRFPALHVAA